MLAIAMLLSMSPLAFWALPEAKKDIEESKRVIRQKGA